MDKERAAAEATRREVQLNHLSREILAPKFCCSHRNLQKLCVGRGALSPCRVNLSRERLDGQGAGGGEGGDEV